MLLGRSQHLGIGLANFSYLPYITHRLYKTIALLPFRIKRKVIMKSWVPLDHFSNGTYINNGTEIEATSKAFRDPLIFQNLLLQNSILIYAFLNVFKTHFNLKIFLYKKINHG